MFYLMTHSTHFIYGYKVSNIWLRTILIVRKETRCCHMGYSFQLSARVLLYASSHRQDSRYHGLCYTSLNFLGGPDLHLGGGGGGLEDGITMIIFPSYLLCRIKSQMGGANGGGGEGAMV